MSINWFPGHMAKARRQIEENLNKVDIIIEILDARIPLSRQKPMIDEIVKNKPRIVILNKADLANQNMTNLWKDYFKSLGRYPVAIDGRSNNVLKNIEPLAVEATKDIFDKMEARGIKRRPVRAMIIGIPNVGKSTLINSLAKRKAARTGNTPGLTKSQQWIKAGNNLELLDTPGVLWPKFEGDIGLKLSLTGAITDRVVHLDEVAIYGMKFLIEHDKENFDTFYNINHYDETDIVSVFDAIGRSRGMLMSGNEVDYEQVTNRVVYDIRNGKIGRYTFDEVNNDD